MIQMNKIVLRMCKHGFWMKIYLKSILINRNKSFRKVLPLSMISRMKTKNPH
jgi:hypothetical protein